MAHKYLGFLVVFTLVSCSDDMSEEMVEKEQTIKIISGNPGTTDHNREFTYQIFSESTAGDTVIYSVAHPAWIEYIDSTATLRGVPGWERLGTRFIIIISATNLVDTTQMSFGVDVVLGEIICDSDFGDPAESKYILPYHVGESFRMWQSYCHPQWSHKNWFSYDFEMPMGTEINASRAGEVIFERDNFPDGTRVSGEENFIFIEHEDGTVVHYVHLMQGGSLVQAGQMVEQGEVIGLSGDSGGSAGPHLHTTQFRDRNSFDRQYSIPMNYRNAEGPLDENNGLVIDKYYKALPWQN